MPNVAIPSDRLDPGIFVKINFGRGPSNAGGGRRDAVYIGAMALSGTTATAGTEYEVKSADHAFDLFGCSPIWWAIKAHFDCSRLGKVYAVAHLPTTADGSYALASATVTIGGTAATADGAVTLRMFGQDEVIGYSAGDLDDDVAAAITGRVNAKVAAREWPLGTATTSTVVSTINSCIPGLSQNGIYAISVSITPNTGLTAAASATSLGSGADGNTTELSRLNTLQAANFAMSHYYVGFTHKQGTTPNGYVKSHMNGRLGQNLSSRGRAFIGGRDAKASLISAATATTVNFERMSIVGEPVCEHDPAQMVGQALAWTQASERLRPNVNMTLGHQEENTANWFLQPVKDVASRMTSADWHDLMEGGVFTIGSKDGASLLVASLTTASKASGSTTIHDRRKWSTHVISVADYFAAVVENRAAVRYKGFGIQDDTRDASGRVNTNYKLYDKRTLFPSTARSFLIAQINDPFIRPMLAHVDDIIIPSIYTGIDSTNEMRMEATMDLRVAPILMQFALEINEVTPG